MATKKQSASDEKTDVRVTRISSTSGKSARKSTTATKATKSKTTKKLSVTAPKKKRFARLRKIGGYFKGAWVELRAVRWPTRQATWSMTGAVLGFSAFFVVLILLLDSLFQFIFERMLG